MFGWKVAVFTGNLNVLNFIYLFRCKYFSPFFFFFIPAYFDEGVGRKDKVEGKREETRNLLWPSLKSLAYKSITFFFFFSKLLTR